MDGGSDADSHSRLIHCVYQLYLRTRHALGPIQAAVLYRASLRQDKQTQ